jgi:hypothetical protein
MPSKPFSCQGQNGISFAGSRVKAGVLLAVTPSGADRLFHQAHMRMLTLTGVRALWGQVYTLGTDLGNRLWIFRLKLGL